MELTCLTDGCVKLRGTHTKGITSKTNNSKMSYFGKWFTSERGNFGTGSFQKGVTSKNC